MKNVTETDFYQNAIPQVYLDFKEEHIKTSWVPFDLFHFAIPTQMNPNEGFHLVSVGEGHNRSVCAC